MPVPAHVVGIMSCWPFSIVSAEYSRLTVGLGMTVLYDGPSGRAVSLVPWPSPGTLIHGLSHARFIGHFRCRNIAGTAFYAGEYNLPKPLPSRVVTPQSNGSK